MFLLGHIGVTIGIVELAELASRSYGAVFARQKQNTQVANPQVLKHSPPGVVPVRGGQPSLFRMVDYRLVMVGSVLPDMVDKPLGVIILGDSLGNGRIFTHTLLFNLVVILLGLYFFAGRGSLRILALGYGSFMHILLDQTWWEPATFLWPLYGWGFPQGNVEGWFPLALQSLSHNPKVYIWEVLGLFILAHFLLRIARQKQILRFIQSGKIGGV